MLEANQMKLLRKIVGKTKIDRIKLRDQLKYQGTIYLSEDDLQDALKEDGAT